MLLDWHYITCFNAIVQKNSGHPRSLSRDMIYAPCLNRVLRWPCSFVDEEISHIRSTVTLSLCIVDQMILGRYKDY